MPFGVLRGVTDIIIHAKFWVNRLRGFSVPAPPKVPFPILFRTTMPNLKFLPATVHEILLICQAFSFRLLHHTSETLSLVGLGLDFKAYINLQMFDAWLLCSVKVSIMVNRRDRVRLWLGLVGKCPLIYLNYFSFRVRVSDVDSSVYKQWEIIRVN